MKIITIDPGDAIVIKDEILYAVKQPSMKEFYNFVMEHYDYLFVIEELALRPSDLVLKGKPNPSAWNKIKMLQKYSQMILIFELIGVKFITVMPNVWQGYLKVNKIAKQYSERKEKLREIAKQTFPNQKVVGWNADAYLIYEFIRQKQMYEPYWINQQLNK